MDMYEEMLLQIVDVLKKHNRPLPDLTHKEAIEEIRSIINKEYPLDTKCRYCKHLIFKDYEHMQGRCSITGIDHNFEDICDHIEDIM